MADATNGRKPNTQPNGLIPHLTVEVLFNGEPLGAIQVPQDPFLSKNGNVLFTGRIARGWTLPGTPEEALEALSFLVNGKEAKRSEKGVNVTAPTKDAKTGRDRPGSGGELLVSHSSIVDVSAADDVETDFIVNIHAKKLKAKAGKEQGFQLRVQGMPKAIGVPGPQVVGEVSGLVLS